MKIYPESEYPQGGLLWLALRAGIPTASQMDALVSPTFKIKTGKGPETFLCEKIAEAWQGGPLPSFQNFEMEQGNILETEAIPWYEFTYNAAVTRVGFITTDDGFCGCSPDGLLSDDCGIEIKAPAAHTHTKYLLAGVLPEEYEHQVHASLFVTGFKRWRFVSYRRNFPALVLTIERDEAKIAVIAEALALFQEKFDAAMKRMEEINGGPRCGLTPMPPKASAVAHVQPLIEQIKSLNSSSKQPLDLTYLQ